MSAFYFHGPWGDLIEEEARARGISHTKLVRLALEALVPGITQTAVERGWKEWAGKSHPRTDRNPYTVRPTGRPKKPPPDGRRDRPGRLGRKGSP